MDKFRLALENDRFDMSMLMPCAPEPPQNMMDYILNRADAIVDKELKALVLLRLEQAGDKIYYYPAAQKLHHAERSGLLHHTCLLYTSFRIVNDSSRKMTESTYTPPTPIEQAVLSDLVDTLGRGRNSAA